MLDVVRNEPPLHRPPLLGLERCQRRARLPELQGLPPGAARIVWSPRTPTSGAAGLNSLAVELVAEIAPRLGYRVHLEPGYRFVGQLIAPDGRHLYFRNTHFDVNGQGSAEIANDKAFAAYFMAGLGYPVAAGETFYSAAWCRVVGSDRDVEAASQYAHRIGFPVFVKPNSKSLGAGVARVHGQRELRRAMRVVFEETGDRVALVQPLVPGDDYRIVVFDCEVIAAYQRLPLSVVGDGRASVRALLAARATALAAARRDTRLSVADRRIAARLRHLNLTPEFVPPAGERVVLLDNANLSTGGDPVDLTDRLHPGYAKLAVDVTRDMGLRYCGVDVLTTGPIDAPPRGHVVLEINPGPGLDHYAALGPPQRARAARLYELILRALLTATAPPALPLPG
jgi:D-alanine-D-alanine ligase-like ATP-grasp enzyme